MKGIGRKYYEFFYCVFLVVKFIFTRNVSPH